MPAVDPGQEEVEVETHAEPDSGFGGLLKRAAKSLKENITDQEPAEKTKRGRPSKSTKEDFSVLIVSVITLGLAFWKIDDDIKPNKNEIDSFSQPLANLMLRHLPINNKLSADAVDILGLLMVSGQWYVRVSPMLQAGKEKSTATRQTTDARQGTETRDIKEPVTDLETLSPADASFLDSIAAKGGLDDRDS